MNVLEAIDSVSFAKSYLKLMWCIHSKYEGLTEEEMTLYRLGMQTFMEIIEAELETISKALESDEDAED